MLIPWDWPLIPEENDTRLGEKGNRPLPDLTEE